MSKKNGAVWSCTVGGDKELPLPLGADSPMRNAVEKVFHDLTGEWPEFTFSGWGDKLSKSEREAHDAMSVLDDALMYGIGASKDGEHIPITDIYKNAGETETLSPTPEIESDCSGPLLIAYSPPSKQNFIALYSDGSGAGLYCWLDNDDICDAEGDVVFTKDGLESNLQDAGFCYWMPLPDTFEFFFMQGRSS